MATTEHKEDCGTWGEFFAKHPDVVKVELVPVGPMINDELSSDITFYGKDSDEPFSVRELVDKSQLKQCLLFLGY